MFGVDRQGAGPRRDGVPRIVYMAESTPDPSARPAAQDGTRSQDTPTEESAALPPALADVAGQLFGDRLALAERYAELLATEGTVRGLLGPRETPRLWDRHLLNCAVLTELIPTGAVVADVGSGAGLPGIVLGVARPDLSVTLIDSLARRTSFLDEVVDELGLDRVTVVRGRAEELAKQLGPMDVVTARAVAPLDRLARWCLPLLPVGGRLLAMKGASASDEVATHGAKVQRAGGEMPEVVQCGVGLVEPPTTVIEVVRRRTSAAGSKRGRGRT